MATDKQRDQRLRRVYGISLERYNQMLAEQGNACAICGKDAANFKKALHVDHDHRAKYVKVSAITEFGLWTASAEYNGHRISTNEMIFGRKCNAVAYVRNALKTLSVRGLLCWNCNAALRSLSDDHIRFHAAANYLRKFQGLPVCGV